MANGPLLYSFLFLYISLKLSLKIYIVSDDCLSFAEDLCFSPMTYAAFKFVSEDIVQLYLQMQCLRVICSLKKESTIHVPLNVYPDLPVHRLYY
ncbi:hypothetical protein H5410_019204 [Solanum commersonii]|uniref:Uncharacterized protein n=1 Tax=Solanum commersonii TaxID=4109 RepID=A0A9J6A5B2_SOLCO|nr:hypothetical protein H5410_019204 [Solanum commersonii]